MSARSGRAAAVTRGLVACVVLLGLLGGLPAALAVYGASLFPHHLSFSLSGIGHALTSPDNGGQLFMQALVIMGWLGWASFAVSVLVETFAQLRRRPTIRIKGLGWSQSAAGTLITSITVMLAAPLAPLAQAAPVHAQTVAASSAIAGAPAAATTTPTAPTQATTKTAPPTTTYAVKPHDTLWGIAEKLLGAGDRFHEIAALNEGHTMTGGAVFHVDGFLQPGWVLKVPAHTEPASAPATASPATTSAAPVAAHQVTVRPGDSLWKIAGREYGDPEQYPVLERANLGHIEDDGERFTNPDLIQPGWVLQVPQLDAAPSTSTTPAPPATTTTPPATSPTGPASTATAPSTTATTPAPSAGATGSAGAPAATQAAPSTAASSAAGALPGGPSAGATSDAGAATSAPTAAPSSDSTVASDSGADAASPESASDSSAVATVLGICGLTAAGVLGLLAFKRSRQQRTRRPGRRIRMPQAVPPPGQGTVDVRLRMTATAGPADLADRALRTLSELCRQEERPVPPLFDALLDDAGLHLRLTIDAEAPAPFTAQGRIWSLAPDARLLDDAACAEVPAPYPGLVAVGQTGANGQLLVDVEACRLLAVDGDAQDVEHVLRALLVELATSQTAGEVMLVAIGLDELAGAIGEPRVQVLPTVAAALHKLGNHAESTAAAMADLQLPDLHAARTAGSDEAANWTPLIVISGRELDETETARAAGLLQQFPFAPIALIAPAGHLIAAFPSAQVLHADAEIRPWPGLSAGLLAQRLDDTDYPQILEYLTVANDPVDVPAHPWATESGQVLPEQVWHGWEQQAAAADPQIPAVWATATVAAPTAGAGSPSALPASLVTSLPTGWPAPGQPTGGQDDEQGFRLANIVSAVDAEDDNGEPDDEFDDGQDQEHDAQDDASQTPAPWLSALQFGGPLADVDDEIDDPNEPEETDAEEPDTEQAEEVEDDDLAAVLEDTSEEAAMDAEPAEEHRDAGEQTTGPDLAPAELEDEKAAVAPLRGHPQVRLLGPVDVVGVDGTVDNSRRDRYTEMAAYLVLHPGATQQQFSDALWPGGVTGGSRNTEVSRLRSWFSHRPDGAPYLPPIRRDGYRFHPEVGCDWLEFQRLSQLGALRGPDGTPELVAALKLVRGKPLTGIDPGRYAWADKLQQDMISEIADVATMVAEARLAAGDARGALDAALIGISAAPEVERLHRARFMAAGRLGDDEELARAARQLEIMLTDTDSNMQPETRELYREIVEQRRRARQAG